VKGKSGWWALFASALALVDPAPLTRLDDQATTSRRRRTRPFQPTSTEQLGHRFVERCARTSSSDLLCMNVTAHVVGLPVAQLHAPLDPMIARLIAPHFEESFVCYDLNRWFDGVL
jgi:hypothetical protein